MKINFVLLLGLMCVLTAPIEKLQANPRTAFVHLFEWKWNDIAVECENHLGPKGFAAVQVSPPQKSFEGPFWWTRYQPVSYEIEGRSGNQEEFQAMVNRCAAVGVDIYVDIVANHMQAFNKFYPDVPYGPNDFHSCGSSIDYRDAFKIQFCDLSGLSDLKTESDYVRGKIADYMNGLTRMGVKGFRMDAAKHIPSNDIAAILSRLEGSPYIFQEVIGADGEPIQPIEYVSNGDVTEFKFERTIGDYFKGRGSLKDLRNLRNRSDFLPDSSAVVFVSNHDDQRYATNRIVTFKDVPGLNNIAEVFALAYPYGYPKVMSSYFFSNNDQGPPLASPNPNGECSNGWVCEHRWTAIANMVGFRNQTASEQYVSNWWDNGRNQIAFGRGDKGFVVINREDFSLEQRLQTGMAPGIYCDIANANFDQTTASCDGRTIEVDDDGFANFSVERINASAIHIGAVVDAGRDDSEEPGEDEQNPVDDESDLATVDFTCENGFTNFGQSVYIIGNTASLGNWQPEEALRLDPIDYPNWTASVQVERQDAILWKCIIRDETRASDVVQWQGGSNNLLNSTTETQARASF